MLERLNFRQNSQVELKNTHFVENLKVLHLIRIIFFFQSITIHIDSKSAVEDIEC